MSEINYNKFSLAVNIIGCNMETYRHFDAYMIPDENGYGISDRQAKEQPNTFLQNIENYYKNKKKH